MASHAGATRNFFHGIITNMTETSGAQHEYKLSPSSSSETLDSLQTKEDDIDLNHGEYHKASDIMLVEYGLVS